MQRSFRLSCAEMKQEARTSDLGKWSFLARVGEGVYRPISRRNIQASTGTCPDVVFYGKSIIKEKICQIPINGIKHVSYLF